MNKLWNVTTPRVEGEDSNISYDWLYNHILEPELNTIKLYMTHSSFLQITPPANVWLPILSSKIYLKFNNREDLGHTLEMVKKLIEI